MSDALLFAGMCSAMNTDEEDLEGQRLTVTHSKPLDNRLTDTALVT
jgi:hypothetical protein